MSDKEQRELERAVEAGDPSAGPRLLRLLSRADDPRLTAARKLRQKLRRWLFKAQDEAGMGGRVLRFAQLAEVLREGLEVELTPNTTFAFRRLCSDRYDGVSMFCCCFDGSKVRLGLRKGGGGTTIASYWPDAIPSWSGKGTTREKKLRDLKRAKNVVDVDRAVVDDLLRFESWSHPNDYEVWLQPGQKADAPKPSHYSFKPPSAAALKKLEKLKQEPGVTKEILRLVLWEVTGQFKPERVWGKAFNAALRELERLAKAGGEEAGGSRAEQLAAERKRLLPFKELKLALEALTTRGGGRTDTLWEAFDEGLFDDERLLPLAVLGLGDPISGLADLLMERILPRYEKAATPHLEAGFDPKGDRSHGRRLDALVRADRPAGLALARKVLEGKDPSGPVAQVAIELLGKDAQALPLIRPWIDSRHDGAREAARAVVGSSAGDDERIASLLQALRGKDIGQVPKLLEQDLGLSLWRAFVEEAHKQLEVFTGKRTDPALKKTYRRGIAHVQSLLTCFKNQDPAERARFALACWNDRETLLQLKMPRQPVDLVSDLVWELCEVPTEATIEALLEDPSAWEYKPGVVFGAALEGLEPKRLYDVFGPMLESSLGDRSQDRITGGIVGGLTSGTPEQVDPRWLDLAVAKRHIRLTSTLIQPDHKAGLKFLAEIALSPCDEVEHDQPRDTGWRDPRIYGLLGLIKVDAANLESIAVDFARLLIADETDDLHCLHNLPSRIGPALEKLLPEAGSYQDELRRICEGLKES